MPDPRIPKMCHHKASGQAVVAINYKDHYLGPWGSQQARDKYDRLIAEWLTAGRSFANSKGELTVNDLIAEFWKHAEVYYKKPDGTDTGELHCLKDAIRPLCRLYGETKAEEFGPLSLKAVRQQMIASNLSRREINRRVGRIVRAFKWAVGEELISATVFHGLKSVDGLKQGRCGVRESEPVRPVPEDVVAETLKHCSPTLAAMIQIQMITGMRPGELVMMRRQDIKIENDVWEYYPPTHKTKHLGHQRFVPLGPKCQAILKPFLQREGSEYIFSPKESVEQMIARRNAARKTPISCGNVRGSNVKRYPKKKPAEHYTTNSYAHAIKYACKRAFPPPMHLSPQKLANGKFESLVSFEKRLSVDELFKLKNWHIAHQWHPHQLRHTAATRLRRIEGIEAAQVVLGHKTLSVTEIYAEKNVEAARQLMAKHG